MPVQAHPQSVSDHSAVHGPSQSYLCIKRMSDVVFALLGLVLLFVPMLVVALLIKCESPGPVLFRQQRMGLGGKSFTIFKFRTMRQDAPSEMATLEFKDSSDYITKFGSFLRRSSLDEVPQLLNILKGDMSFVGYRPVCLTEEQLNENRLKSGVFALRPGITGLAQVKGRDTLRSTEKVVYDQQYVQQCSARLDVWCCLQTVKTVISGKGAI